MGTEEELFEAAKEGQTIKIIRMFWPVPDRKKTKETNQLYMCYRLRLIYYWDGERWGEKRTLMFEEFIAPEEDGEYDVWSYEDTIFHKLQKENLKYRIKIRAGSF